jgi:molybdopterin synthase catalytic subunit
VSSAPLRFILPGVFVIRLVTGPINVNDVLRAVADPACGGTCVFVGTVRPDPDTAGRGALDYEAYAPMAVRMLEEIASTIRAHEPAARVAIVHRTGRIPVGEASVVIAVATPHRALAFELCREAMEKLKKDVPIWKTDYTDSG